MSYLTVKKLRERTWHSISPHAAHAGGMTLGQLQQFVAGTYHPDEQQLRGLANYYGIKVT